MRHGLQVIFVWVIALCVGWGLGSWSTCGSVCGFSVELFGALAGWVGGLATAGAAWFAAYQFRESVRDADVNALSIAQMCTLRISPTALVNGRYLAANVTFTNRTSMALTDLIVRYDGRLARESPPSMASLVAAGAQPWGFKLVFADHGLPPISRGNTSEPTKTDAAVQERLNLIRDELEFEFCLGRRRFTRSGSQASRVN